MYSGNAPLHVTHIAAILISQCHSLIEKCIVLVRIYHKRLQCFHVHSKSCCDTHEMPFFTPTCERVPFYIMSPLGSRSLKWCSVIRMGDGYGPQGCLVAWALKQLVFRLVNWASGGPCWSQGSDRQVATSQPLLSLPSCEGCWLIDPCRVCW